MTLRQFFRGKKKRFYAIGVGIFALALLCLGVTLAYFTSTDTVTNQVTAPNIEIALLEPQWDASGENSAKNAEPGETIPKDPYVYNKSEIAVYVRMQIHVTDANGGEITGDRLNSILSAIYYDDTTTLWDDELTASQNLAYYYHTDGWFYYATFDSIEETVTMTSVAALGSTTELFTSVQIPALHADYDSNFDSEFHINVVAQAISAENVLTFSEAVEKFEEEYEE